jgi:hypothetical protein
MTATYRRKLLKWLMSMLLVGTIVSLSAVATWFIQLAPFVFLSPPTHISEVAGPMGESLLPYPVFFLPSVVWHLFDFLQAREPVLRTLKLLAAYRTFFTLIAVAGSAWLLIGSGWFTVTECAAVEPGTVCFDCCQTAPSSLLTTPFYLCLLFLIILCMGKAVISIRSLLKTAK